MRPHERRRLTRHLTLSDHIPPASVRRNRRLSVGGTDHYNRDVNNINTLSQQKATLLQIRRERQKIADCVNLLIKKLIHN